MNYSTTNLSSASECDALLSLANRDKENLLYRRSNLNYRKSQVLASSADFEADYAEVVNDLQSLTTSLLTFPEGKRKEEMITDKMALEVKLRVMNERKDNYGIIGILQREYDLAVIDESIAETDAFIAAIDTRKAQLVA
jgi:hypothetical protein